MTDTSPIEVRNKPYFIKRFTFGETNAIEDFTESHKNDRGANQAFIVFTGAVKEDGTPYFESVEAVQKEDHETIIRLWFEIDRFNRYDTTFLLLLKNLSPPGAQPDAIRQP